MKFWSAGGGIIAGILLALLVVAACTGYLYWGG